MLSDTKSILHLIDYIDYIHICSQFCYTVREVQSDVLLNENQAIAHKFSLLFQDDNSHFIYTKVKNKEIYWNAQDCTNGKTG